MDFEFDNALFWGDENDGKTPIRKKRPKSNISVKTTLDADSSPYSDNDQEVGKSRPVTPISHFTNATAPLHSSTSLYTSSEIGGLKRYLARTAANPLVSRAEPVIAPTPNRNPLQSRPLDIGYGAPGSSLSNSQSFKYGRPTSSLGGQNFKYGRPILSSSGSQNHYRNEQRPQNQDRGRRAYTDSTPSVPGSRSRSRPGRNSFHRGSDIEGDGGFRSAYITPNLYLSDPFTLGLGPDGYEGPDGFLRDNDADRAERAGFAPDGKLLLVSAYSTYSFQNPKLKLTGYSLLYLASTSSPGV